MGVIIMEMTYMVPYLTECPPLAGKEKKVQMENSLRNNAQWIPMPLGITFFSFISFILILPKFQLISKLPKLM